jgi:peptide subunit release factor 1 (eRF1)
VGEFPIGMSAGYLEVLEQASQKVLDVNEKVNQALVKQSITLAAKGSNGVIGLIDTLNAIREGRVKTLLVLDDFAQAGYRCDGCGYLSVQEVKTCPFCNGHFQRIDDAVEMAVREAIRNNADVKVLTHDPTLEQHGKISAILRY